MSNRPSPLGWLTKFVVAPVSLAAIGYYVVGPRVGGDLKAAAKVPGLNQLVAKGAPAPPKPAEPGPQYQRGPDPTPVQDLTTHAGGPQVDVDVRPSVEAPVEEPKPKPRRKRRKPKPAPVETPQPAAEPVAPAPTVLEPAPASPPPTDPPADQGGSGGAATAGGA